MPRQQGGLLLERIWGMLTFNFGTKAVSIIIAVVLWAIVLGSRNVEVTKEIPLELITSSDVLAANDVPDRIAFRLSGPKAFLRNILDRREDPIRVNLSHSRPALVTYRFFSDSIRVPIGVKVLSINPSAILIKLEYVKRAEVPIRLELKGEPPPGYRISKAEIRPPTVKIRGAESRIEGISELVTLPIDISHLTGSLEKEVPLDLTRYNIRVEGDLPRLKIELTPVPGNFKFKNLDIH